jgi:hypothetical protein
MLALLVAALCPQQSIPAVKLAPGEVLLYKLDALGTDVGTFEVRVETPPPAEKSRAVARLSSRAKTNSFMATNVGRYEAYATSVIGRDYRPLHYREDVDENDLHRGTELQFPPQDGTLAVKATKNGEPEPFTVQAGDDVRDMMSTLYLLRQLPLNQPVCLEVFAGRKVWRLTGQMRAKETIDTPIGRFPSLRFEGEAVRLDDPKAKRTALVWVSDDERRLPLVAIGEVRGKTIRAQLVSMSGMRRAAKK